MVNDKGIKITDLVINFYIILAFVIGILDAIYLPLPMTAFQIILWVITVLILLFSFIPLIFHFNFLDVYYYPFRYSWQVLNNKWVLCPIQYEKDEEETSIIPKFNFIWVVSKKFLSIWVESVKIEVQEHIILKNIDSSLPIKTTEFKETRKTHTYFIKVNSKIEDYFNLPCNLINKNNLREYPSSTPLIVNTTYKVEINIPILKQIFDRFIFRMPKKKILI